MVVNHPVRRKILTMLIFLGNAGVITTISSALFSFIQVEDSGLFSVEVLVFFSGLGLLIFLSQSKWVDRKLSVIINKALKKYTNLDVRDYYSLLHLSEDYRVTEIRAGEYDWITGGTLSDLAGCRGHAHFRHKKVKRRICRSSNRRHYDRRGRYCYYLRAIFVPGFPRKAERRAKWK